MVRLPARLLQVPLRLDGKTSFAGRAITVPLKGHWAALVEAGTPRSSPDEGRLRRRPRGLAGVTVGHPGGLLAGAYSGAQVRERPILGRPDAAGRALAADVVWIHEPTCFAAAELAEGAEEEDAVVLDFSEDVWARGDVDAATRTRAWTPASGPWPAGSLIVATSRNWLPFSSLGRGASGSAVIPVGPEWNPSLPATPRGLPGRATVARSAAWSCGAGLTAGDGPDRLPHGPRAVHHHAPLMQGLKTNDERAGRHVSPPTSRTT